MRITAKKVIVLLTVYVAHPAWASTPVRNYTVRQERFESGSLLIARPAPLDEAIRDFVLYNSIFSCADYFQWLKRNIRYKKDDAGDHWAHPVETLKRKRGDCEDFAFLSEAVLRVLGYQPKVLGIMGKRNRHHAVCVFKENGVYSLVDNKRVKKTSAHTYTELLQYLFRRFECARLKELDFHTHSSLALYTRSEFSL